MLCRQVAPLIANFNPYVNDMWVSRRTVLMRFQQAARKVLISVFVTFSYASDRHRQRVCLSVCLSVRDMLVLSQTNNSASSKQVKTV